MRTTDFAESYPGRLISLSGEVVAFVPNALPPNLRMTPAIRELHDEALLALGGLREIIPFLPNPQLITAPFQRREAVLSSKIEGTRTNLEELYVFEIEGLPNRGAESAQAQDAQEVHNYVRALEYGLAKLPRLPVCGRLLREMHAVLMEGTRGAFLRPGQFRSGQAYIGSGDILSARYVAPPANELEPLFRDFEEFVIAGGKDLPSLVWVALIHYQFEAIHPFTDGNGRIGRLLILLLLASRGILTEPLLYLSAYFERNRRAYYDHLSRITHSGAWEDWLLFFLEGVRHESVDAARRAREVLRLREKYRAELQARRGKVFELVDALFRFPATTVRAAQKLLGLKTYHGAQKNIELLIAHGILSPGEVSGKTQIYVAKPIIEILSANLPAEKK
jgi:Fic family protein